MSRVVQVSQLPANSLSTETVFDKNMITPNLRVQTVLHGVMAHCGTCGDGATSQHNTAYTFRLDNYYCY